MAGDHPLLEPLEPRMLFSAEPFGFGADLFNAPDGAIDSTEHQTSQLIPGYELVLINDNVEDIDTLITDLHQQAEAGRKLVVHVLDSHHSGMLQVSDILSDHEALAAIHVLSHGNSDGVQVGGSWIDNSTIDIHNKALSTWQDHLSDQSRLLFYGCDLAGSDHGIELLNKIGSLTGAVVAGSTDTTGHTLLQGDWDLEYRTDTIAIEPLLSADAAEAWLDELATYIYRNGDSNSYSQALDTHIAEANASQTNGSSGDLVISGIASAESQALLSFGDFIGDVGGRIPAGTTVTSATLTLEINNPAQPGSMASVHQMLQDWSEYTTWSHFGDGVQADDSEASSTLLAQFNADATGTVNLDVTSSVQAWLNGDSNYGFLITTDASGSELRIHASDSNQTAQRPQLTIITSGGLVVSTTDDVLDGTTTSIAALEANPGSDGEVSLREAVIAANNTPGEDTITLPAGTYDFAISGNDDNAEKGDLDVLEDLIINGAGISSTIIDGNALDRHFDVRNDASAQLTLNDMTLTDGSAARGAAISVESGASLDVNRVTIKDSTTSGSDKGGGIYSLGTTTINDSIFLRNSADNKEGGAIYAEGVLTINDSVFDDNDGQNGGAIQFSGTTLTINDSDFHGNTAIDRGGALDINDGTSNISRSSLHDNKADDGGAINMDGSALVTIEQSTISGNEATTEGGGIRARGGSNTLDIVSSTVAYNDAANDGGGLDNNNGDVTTTITNSIFQGNTKNGGTNNENFRTDSNLNSGGYNIISDGTSGFSSSGDQTNQDARLNPTLTYPSGSSVAVHLLYPDSPARDSGDPSVTTTDSSDHPRAGTPDRGAAESFSTSAVHTGNAPAIDGEVDALWNDAAAEALLDYAGDVTTPPSNPGATWRAAWNDDALYLLVEVSDATPYEDSVDIWDDDAIAVYLDPDVSRATSYDGVDDTNFYIGRDHDALTLVNDPLALSNVSVATVNTTTGYTKEIAIPWSELGIVPSAGTQIGIELHLNDDANGGANDTELLWADSLDRAWIDPSTFGSLLLDDADDTAGPDGLNHGIAINMDGGNNTWFQAPSSVTLGLASHTVQTRFTTSVVQGLSILPLVDAGGLSYFLTADMANGVPRTHTEIWDATTGTRTAYLDGVLLRQDTFPGEIGKTITTTHPIVIGQNNTTAQMSLNPSAFDPASFFSGTIHDVRVYDYAFSADDVGPNMQRQFSADNPPAGLIANWRFDRLTGDNDDRVVDLINPGINDMIVNRRAADGSTWVDSTPSDQLQISDAAQTGDVIGHLSPTDAEVINEVYTYTLIDDANGRFDVNASTGQLLVADSASIEGGDSGISYAVTIRVTDESGQSFDRRLTIQADPVNEAPTLTGLPARDKIDYGGDDAVQLGAGLLPDDPELTALDSYGGFELTLVRSGGDNPEDVFSLGSYHTGLNVVYADGDGSTIGSVLQNAGGKLALQFNANATADAVRDTVRAITYKNTGDSSSERSVTLQWTLNDNNVGGAQGSGGSLNSTVEQAIHIKPPRYKAVDDVIGGSDGVVSGSNNTIVPSGLTGNDLGTGGETPIIINTTNPNIGTLTNASGTYSFATTAGASGTSTFDYLAAVGDPNIISQWPLLVDGSDEAQRNSGSVVSNSPPHELQFDGDDYVQIANIDYPNEWTLTFDFKVNDLDHSLSETFVANGKYTSSNSLHVWASGKSHWNPSDRGKLITHIKDSSDSDFGWSGYKYDVTAFEEDNLWHNYAIVVREGTGASIYIDGVEQDTSSATRGESAFNPTDPIYVGVGDHNIVGLDSWLTNHEIANLRLVNGFDEPAIQANELNQYSSATVSAIVRNEETVVDNISITVEEDQSEPITTANLRTTDIEQGPSALVYEIRNTGTYGTLVLDGSDLGDNDTFTQADIGGGKLEYRHDGHESATDDTILLRVDDGVGSHTDLTYSVVLTPVNEAPSISSATLTPIAEDADPPGATVSSLFSAGFTDVDSSMGGIAIVADATTTEGVWEYSTDAGTSWNVIGAVSTSNAAMLKASAMLRFSPTTQTYGSVPPLTVHAVDDSYTGAFAIGAAMAHDNLTTTGGSSPFSAMTAQLDSEVRPVGPTGLSRGIELNIDGGNDSYLIADDGGALLGGLTEVTMQAQFAIDTVNSRNALISYSAIAGDDTLKLLVRSNGVVDVGVLGNDVLSAPVPALVDGNIHSVAATWSSENGQLHMYADGQLVHSVSGIATGQSLQSGGTLVMGMEQDSPGGGFEISEVLSGTLHDVRLWDSVRSPSEIQLDHYYKLQPTNLPDSLLANWQMDSFNGTGAVVDRVGGNNLNVAHASGSGFTTSTPVGAFSVAEDAPAGTVLGTVLGGAPWRGQDLVQDGGFTAADDTAITIYTAGETIGAGSGFWQVDSGTVDTVPVWEESPHGGVALDLNGNNPGAISQTIATEPGKSYEVNFALSGNFSSATQHSLRVSAGPSTVDLTVDQPDYWAGNNLLWERRSVSFVATSDTTTISFASLTASGPVGPVISDVEVLESNATVDTFLATNPNLIYSSATGKFYQTDTTYTDWVTAQNNAVATELNGVSGRLVTIGSAYENSLVRSIGDSMGFNFHLGASDQTTEGQWFWQTASGDGESLWTGASVQGVYTNWKSGEPNNHGSGEHHAMMFRDEGDGDWNDAKLEDHVASIIEWDAHAVLSKLAYSIQSDPANAFTIGERSGELTLNNISGIDHAIDPDYDIVVRVTDAAGEFHDETITISVIDQSAPQITAMESSAFDYFENSGSVPISSTLIVSDSDDTMLESASISIRNGFESAGDTLSFNSYGPFSSSLDGDATTLTIDGPATTAEWQTALRSVTFSNDEDNTNNRNILFDFAISDGFETSNTATRTGNFILINDAPSLNDGTLNSIYEDDTNPVGQTVNELFAAQFNDPDGTFGGIAITDNTATVAQGVWQYSVDNGTDWQPVDPVSQTHALTLSSSAMLRFVPTIGFNGTVPPLTVVGIDNTHPTASFTSAGGVVLTDVLIRGGTTAYSLDVASLDSLVLLDRPTDLSSGIQLNTDGGNDAYLIAENGGALLGGLTALTIESQFAVETSSQMNPLLSYATASKANALLLAVDENGTVFMHIDDQRIDVPVDHPQLLDGNRHSVALSWNSLHGTIAFYIDGELAHSALGFKAGYNIEAGGELVLGQDQDVPDGGYNSSQSFQGALYDLRLWNEARTEAEITHTHRQIFYDQDLPASLIANWQMDGISVNSKVVDIVSDHAMVVNHVTDTGFTYSSPRTALSITEGTPNGVIIGNLTPTAPGPVNDLVTDGLFTYAGHTTDTHYNSGNIIGGVNGAWQVDNATIGVEASWGDSPLGGRAIDLDGTTPGGAISQTLTTEVGKTYELRFAMTGNFSSGATKSMTVTAGSDSATLVVSAPAGWAYNNLLWNQRSMTFTATSDSTVLSFASNSTSGNHGPAISDVQVVEVPAAVATMLASDTSLSYDGGTGKFYRTVSSPTTWESARDAAMADELNGVSGQLATIDSDYENTVVHSFAAALSSDVHIGATDTTVNGEWHWQNGSSDSEQFWSGRWAADGGVAISGTYNNWGATEPNDAGNIEHYANLRHADGFWNDIPPDRSRPYIVEWNADEVLSNYRFELLSDPALAFAIDESTGAVSVADTGALDFENTASHDITVRVTDAAGESYDEVVTIRVGDAAAPVLSGIEPAALSYTENSGAIAITSTLEVTDTDDIELQSARVSFSSGYISGEDLLNFPSTPQLTGNWDAGSGELSITATDTITAYSITAWQAALRTVTYENVSDDPDTGSRTINFTIDDTLETSNAVTRSVDIVAVNDSPSIAATNPVTVTEDDSDPAGHLISGLFPVVPTDIDGSVIGIAITKDPSTFEGQWQYSTDAGVEWYELLPSLEISETRSIVLDINHHLRFVPAPDYHGSIPALTVVAVDDSSTGTVTEGNLRVVANVSTRGDSTPFSATTVSINGNVTPVFDAPTNIGTVPLSIDVFEDTDSAIDLSGIDIDPRDHSGDLTLRLNTIAGGNLTAVDNPVVNIARTANNIELTASAADLNAYLNSPNAISYRHSAAHTNGFAADTLVISLLYGSSDEIIANPAIHITAINDSPTAGDSRLAMVEDTPYALTVFDISFSDPHDGDNLAAVQIDSVPVNIPILLNGIAVNDGDTISVTDIAAGNLVLHPPLNGSGNDYDSLVYRVLDDGGRDNSGDDLSDVVTTLTLDITPVNDTPSLAVIPVSIPRGESVALTGIIQAIDPDVEASQLVMSLTSEPAYGELQKSGIPLAVNETFTQADVDVGSIYYVHNGSEAIDDAFAITFVDQGSDATNLTLARILTIAITETHPQGEADSASVNEGASVDISVLDNDQPSDEPLNNASVTIVQMPSHGFVSIDDVGVVNYEHRGSETTTDSFSYTVADSGGQVSDSTTVSITVNPVNDKPELQLDANGPNVTEQSTPVIVSPTLQIVDAELSRGDNFNGSTLQLQRDTGASTLDQFNTGAPALGVLIHGADLILNGQVVGTVVQNAGGSLLLQFNSAATGAIVNEVASSIGYRYNGDTPPAGITLQWQFNDANSGSQGSGGAHTVNAVVGIDITAVNDTPVLSVGSDIAIHTEAADAVAIAPLITITDAELDLLDSAALPVVTLQRTSGANVLDEFVASGQLGKLTATADFTDAGVRLGTVLDNSAGLLQIEFDAGVDTTQISSALAQIAYRYQGDAPPPQVSLQWAFSDGNSGTQGTGGIATGVIESLVTILATDDPPLINGLATTTLAYSHRSPGIAIGSSIELADPDSTTLTRAEVWIDGYQPGIDVLALPSPGSLNLNWDANNGVLTLNGTADLATYQNALHTLIYQSHDLPAATETPRTIRLTVVDNSGTESDTESVEVLLTIPENPLVVSLNQTLQIFTGDRTTIGPVHLRAIDIYSEDRAPTSIEFHISALPDAGTLLLDNQPVTVGDSFTQHDLQQGNLDYQHTAGSAGLDQFGFNLRDADEDGATPVSGHFEIEIREPLAFIVAEHWSILEGETITLSTDQIDRTGGYLSNAELLIRVDTPPASVELLNSASAQAIDQFTLQELVSGLVSLRHDGSEDSTVTIPLVFQHQDENERVLLDEFPVVLTVVDVADSPTGVDSKMATDHINELAITEQLLGFDDTDDGDVLVAMQINNVPEHGTLLLSGDPLEPGAKIDIQLLRDGQLTYVPDPLTRGTATDTINFTLIDSGNPSTGGSNRSASAYNIEILVNSDHKPQAVADTIRVEEGGVATQLVSGADRVTTNDTDWDTPTEDLLVQLLSEPEYGALTLNQDGSFSYNHDGGESRSDSFSYRVADDATELAGTEGSVATVEIDIEPRNDAPDAGVAADQWLQTNEFLQLELPDDLFVDRDTADTLTLSATLSDGSPLPAWLSFDPATFAFSGTPDATDTGTLEILVVATDSAGATAESRFEITVSPVPAAASETPLSNIDIFDSSTSSTTAGRTDGNADRASGTVISNHSLTLASEAAVSDEDTSKELILDRESSSLPKIQANADTRDRLIFFEDRVIRHNNDPAPQNTPDTETKIEQPQEVVELAQLLSLSDGQVTHISDPAIHELNRIKDELNASAETAQAIVVSGTIVSTGLSVGYIIWLIRGGMLLGSVMSSMPAWCFVDPLPVLRDLGNNNEEDDTESLQSLVDSEDSGEENPPPPDSSDKTDNGDVENSGPSPKSVHVPGNSQTFGLGDSKAGPQSQGS